MVVVGRGEGRGRVDEWIGKEIGDERNLYSSVRGWELETRLDEGQF